MIWPNCNMSILGPGAAPASDSYDPTNPPPPQPRCRMHWAAHLYRLAVRNLRPLQPRHKRRSSLRLESLEIRAVPHITGTVFIDLNQDGIQDPEDLGVAGVVVRATDETGATSEATTGDDG